MLIASTVVKIFLITSIKHVYKYQSRECIYDAQITVHDAKAVMMRDEMRIKTNKKWFTRWRGQT